MVWIREGTHKCNVQSRQLSSRLDGHPKHTISYPISSTLVNILFFETIPDGLGQPLPGASVSRASKEDVIGLYKDWEDDLVQAIDVRSRR